MQRQRIPRRLRDKIHSEEGFTLSETLMTVVLIGLITMAMAGGIVAAKNVYQRISLRARSLQRLSVRLRRTCPR